MSTVNVANVKSNTSGPPVFQNTSGTEIGRLCRAFVNFDGTGTVAIRAQFNVSSITDNGLGDYTVNFTTALADANYSVAGVTADSANAPYPVLPSSASLLTSSVRIVCYNYVGNLYDTSAFCVSIFR